MAAAAKPKSALRTVDPLSHSSLGAEIYEDCDGLVWNAMLNLTDISYGTFGNNKFYSIQLISDNGRYKVFRKWGRVGAAKPQSAIQYFSSADQAESAFQKNFVTKSGNHWPLANGAFEKKKGKYVFVELADDEPADAADNSGGDVTMKDASGNGSGASKVKAETVKCSLSETVQDVLKLISDSTLIAKEVSSMNVDLKRMPLGRLSKAQISQGYALLQQLSDALNAIEEIENPSAAVAAPTLAPVAAPTPTASGRTSRRRAAASNATPTATAAATTSTSASASAPAAATTASTTTTGRTTRGRAAKAKAAASAAAAPAQTQTPAAAPTPAPARAKKSKKMTAADAKRVRELKVELKTLSSEFYSLIPHDFGRALPPVLDTLEVVKTKIDLLQVLADIELSQQLLQEEKKQQGGADAAPVHPLDAQYKRLDTKMEALDPASDEFQLIERYIARTQAPSQTAYRLKIKSVLKIARPAEEKRRSVFEQVDNHRLLWHGSRLSNVVGILSQGLRIAPPEAPKNGYMFGKGIYFADSVSKSAQYCWTSPDRPRAVMLLAEVALGKSYEAPRAEYLGFNDIDARGCASTKGVGRMAPREETFETMADGVVVPSGAIAPQSATPAGVMFNEFIVYRPEQVKLRYLITTDFDYAHKSGASVRTKAAAPRKSVKRARSNSTQPTTGFSFGATVPSSSSFQFGSTLPASSPFGFGGQPLGGFGASSSTSPFRGTNVTPVSAFGQPAVGSAAAVSSVFNAPKFGSGAFGFGSTTTASGSNGSSVFGSSPQLPSIGFSFGASPSPAPTSSGIGASPSNAQFDKSWYWVGNAWHQWEQIQGTWRLVLSKDMPPSGHLVM